MKRMSTKSREVIWGGQIMGAKKRAQAARDETTKAVRSADRAEAEAWSVRMEGYVGRRNRRRPSPNASTAALIGSKLNAGAARQKRASRLSTCAALAILRSGSLKGPCVVDHAEHGAIDRRCTWSSSRPSAKSHSTSGCIRTTNGERLYIRRGPNLIGARLVGHERNDHRPGTGPVHPQGILARSD